MLGTLAPLFGCGLMMALCLALMSGAGSRARRNQPGPSESSGEVVALRDEVAELRCLDDHRRATADDALP